MTRSANNANNFYRNCLSADLQEHVHAQLAKLIPEQYNLSEEVAIHKARVSDLVRDWSSKRQILESLYKLPNVPTNDLIQARMSVDVAAQRMADALKEHKDLSLTAAMVETKTKETLTERTIMLFLNAAIDLAHEMFNLGTKESIARMKQFEHLLRERVVIQEADDNALAIEGEVYAMMQTIEGPSVVSSQSETTTSSEPSCS